MARDRDLTGVERDIVRLAWPPLTTPARTLARQIGVPMTTIERAAHELGLTTSRPSAIALGAPAPYITSAEMPARRKGDRTPFRVSTRSDKKPQRSTSAGAKTPGRLVTTSGVTTCLACGRRIGLNTEARYHDICNPRTLIARR